LAELQNQALKLSVYHARIRSWNQPVLRNEGKVSCSRKQRGPLLGFSTGWFQELKPFADTCCLSAVSLSPFKGLSKKSFPLTLSTGLFFILTYFSSIVKQAMFAYVNHAQIRSWNQPVLSNEGKVSCPRKQRGPLLGLSTGWFQEQIPV